MRIDEFDLRVGLVDLGIWPDPMRPVATCHVELTFAMPNCSFWTAAEIGWFIARCGNCNQNAKYGSDKTECPKCGAPVDPWEIWREITDHCENLTLATASGAAKGQK